ncbi:MAG TPA: HesA/MoeB/ThiF family protein [Candidatus Dormibacteraeota bacterium]|nr:HesA/MoeB/ThiF family protein [Candidatus Dormibacteraeota bacterium]
MNDQRHHRQRILAEIGEQGQRRLASASVAIVGVGGLGSPAALYLASAGVGRIALIDDQRIDRSNLNRQVLYGEADIGRPKVEVAAQRLRAIDSSIAIEPRQESVSAGNVEALFAAYDLVLDGTDAFETKFLLNDAAVLAHKPLVHGAVLQWGGQVLTVLPGGPCLRCLFREPPEPDAVQSCEQAGILGATAGIVGSVQAEEAIKLLLGVGAPLSGRIYQHDGLIGETRITAFGRDPSCPACSDKASITRMSAYAEQVSARGHLLV